MEAAMADPEAKSIHTDDIIWGASAIARELGLRDRGAAYHLLEAGHLPARKIGRQWVASRDRLRRALTGDRAGGE
jgi:hypothetical protein